jgi:lysophospholipase L1-like esterase
VVIVLGVILLNPVQAQETNPLAVRLMPLGNSITDGAAGSTDDTGYRRALYLALTGSGYAVDMVGSQAGGIPTDFQREHEGHGGWHANQIRDSIYTWLTANPADIVLLHIGTNDISGGDEDVNEVRSILDSIDQFETDYGNPITVLLARIILRGDSKNPETIAFNDAVEAMALSRIASGDDIVVVDMEDALSYPADLADAVHPNNAGYAKMSAVWLEALDSMLSLANSGPDYLGVTDLSLTASSPSAISGDDLTCTFTLTGEAITAATAWYRNNQPILALYLPFEGGDTNALRDASGHEYLATVYDDPTFDATGGQDGFGAMAFDGDDHLYGGEVFPTLSSYSVTAWVYRTGSGQDGGNNIISGDVGSGGHAFYAPDSKSNRLAAGHGSTWDIVEDAESLVLDTWYHVALTYDYSTGLMILYKDGLEVDRATVPVSVRDVTDASAYVGSFGNGFKWMGRLDDVRVYNYALSSNQVETLFDSGQNVVLSDETTVGDTWQARVTPYSDTARGSSIGSNVLTIHAVSVDNISLAATSPSNYDIDNLICTYTIGGTATTSAVSFTRDSVPIMALYLPMEGGASNALVDASGNHIATYTNGNPTWGSAAGHDGFGAWIFDGDDCLGAGEKFPIGTSYTKSAWVYRTGSGTNGGNNIISGDVGAGGHAFWAPDTYGNRLSAGHNSHWNSVQDSDPLALNTWYFVAVTFDHSTGEMVLYKNGSEVDRATLPGADLDVTDQTIYIGAFAINHHFMGTIDDARVYDRALSESQIAALYNDNLATIMADETVADEEWQAFVTPYSDSEKGVTVASNPLQVVASPGAELSAVSLSASTPEGTTADDLLCSYTLEGLSRTAATAWYVNGNPLMTLHLPFEGGNLIAVLDVSGSGNHTTPGGAPVWDSLGGHDGYGGIVFDGDDYLSAGAALPLSSSYTKCAWIRKTGTGPSDGNNIMSGTTSAGGHAFWAPGGTLSAGHGGAWQTVSDTEPLSLNTWYHVALSFDYLTGQLVLYKNGIPVDSAPATLSDLTDASVYVGAFNGGHNFVGTIDDARIYNRALSHEQILALYSEGANTIKSSETVIDDVWQAEVTPYSVLMAGEPVMSNSLTVITDEIIELTDLSLTASSPYSTPADELTCDYTLVEDAVTSAVAWYRDSLPMMSLYLPFEGGAGNALLDFSGNELSGAASSGAAWNQTAGHDGHGAFVFDGSTEAEIDYGAIMPQGAYTKTAWVKRTGTGNNNIISGDQSHAFWAPASQSYRLSAGHSPGYTIHVEDTEPLALNTWYFVAVSYDPLVHDGQMILYKNGIPVDLATSVPSHAGSDQRVWIGAFNDANNWGGTIDDARVYPLALSADQIARMYAVGPNAISSSETRNDDLWQARVTPFSWVDAGATVESNEIKIPKIGLDFSPRESAVGPADTFEVDIVVDQNAVGLHCYKVSLDFDRDMIELLDVSEGTLMRIMGENTLFFWKDTAGMYDIGSCLLGSGLDVNGPGVLATLTFRAKAAQGTTALSFYADQFLDTLLNPLPAGPNQGQVFIVDCDSAGISLLPNSKVVGCQMIDTTWVYANACLVNVEDVFLKVGFESDLYVPISVIPGPLLNELNTYNISHNFYTDSLDISITGADPYVTGPGYICGIVSGTIDETAAMPLEILTSFLRDPDGVPVNHSSEGATVQIDCTPPLIEILAPPAGYRYDSLPTLSVHLSDDIELAQGLYKIDACSSPMSLLVQVPPEVADTVIQWTVPPVSLGEHTIYFRALDAVGNVSADPCTNSWTFRYGVGCCIGITGNVDNDPDELVDIGDLTRLIDYLYISRVEPYCLEEANIDGDTQNLVDIGDLTALIDYLYISNFPPAVCR